jgi:hypothetical protein
MDLKTDHSLKNLIDVESPIRISKKNLKQAVGIKRSDSIESLESVSEQ